MEWLWNGYGMVKTPIEVRLKSNWNGIVEQRFRFWILKIPIFISKNEEEDDQDHDQNYFFIFKISNDFTPFNLFVNLGSEL